MVLLLLTGWAIKMYRAAHPPPARQRYQPSNLDMQEVNFDEAMDKILAQDPRFARDAYHFTRESLDYTQKLVSKEKRPRCATM